jgi:hypothetical protein
MDKEELQPFTRNVKQIITRVAFLDSCSKSG